MDSVEAAIRTLAQCKGALENHNPETNNAAVLALRDYEKKKWANNYTGMDFDRMQFRLNLLAALAEELDAALTVKP